MSPSDLSDEAERWLRASTHGRVFACSPHPVAVPGAAISLIAVINWADSVSLCFVETVARLEAHHLLNMRDDVGALYRIRKSGGTLAGPAGQAVIVTTFDTPISPGATELYVYRLPGAEVFLHKVTDALPPHAVVPLS